MTEQHNTRVPQFFLTPGGPCPYLPGRTERKVFARLTGTLAQPLSEALTHSGFRRSQSHRLSPRLRGLRGLRLGAHRGERIRTLAAARSASLKRNARSGAQRSAGGGDARAIRAAAHLSGFAPCRRRHVRHGSVRLCRDGRRDAGRHPYRRISPTRRDGEPGALVACALTDVLRDGLSMVYSFFHPGEDARSLGTYMILDHVARPRRRADLPSCLSRLLGRRAARRWTTRPASAAGSAGREGWERLNHGTTLPLRAGRQFASAQQISGRGASQL